MKFIPDSEINLLETKDLLGTKPYSELLYDIVTKCSTPFNIGLLGGWGSGKSTIIKTLKNILINKNKQIKVFTYDAWKYSKDSFRRTFIMELNNFLKNKPSEDLEKILYCDTTEEKEGEVKISKKGILSVLALSPLLLLLFLISKQLGTDIKVVIAFLSVFLSAMIFIISQLIISYKISISKAKIFSPEQFSDIFKEIVQVLVSEKKSRLKWIKKSKDSINDIEKLVIVIDNVDRCDNKTVIKTLQTVKNFLNHQNIVFIIPLDEVGIMSFLNFDTKDANEYLRKVFKTIIRIKKFTPTELFDYTQRLNQEYDLNLSNNIIGLVCKEYTTNPRKIIQFLNNFQAEIKLAEKQEQSKYIKGGAITNNLDFLAKLIIIKDEWRDLYLKLEDNPKLINNLSEEIVSKSFEKTKGKYYIKISNTEIILNDSQFRFLKIASPIRVENPEPFFLNRSFEQDYPSDISQFIDIADWVSVKLKLEEKDTTFDLFKLMIMIKNKYENEIIKFGQYELIGFSVISLLFQIISDSKYSNQFRKELTSPDFKFIHELFKDSEFQTIINKLDYKQLVYAGKWFEDVAINVITNCIVNLLNNLKTDEKSAQSSNEKIIEFLRIYDKPEILGKCKTKFSDFFAQNIGYMKGFVELNLECQLYISITNQNLVKSIIENIEKETDREKSAHFIDFLVKVKLNKSLSVPDKTIEKFSAQVLNQNNWNLMTLWFDRLCPFIQDSTSKSKETLNNLIKTRYSFLFQQYSSNQLNPEHISCYKNFINLIFEYQKLYKKDEILTYLLNFFNHNSPQTEVYQSIIPLFKYEVEKYEPYNWAFSGPLIKKLVQQNTQEPFKILADLINKMLYVSNEEVGIEKAQIEKYIQHLINLIISNSVLFEIAIESINLVSKNKYVKTIIIEGFSKITDVNQQSVIIKNAKKITKLDLLGELPKNYLSAITSDDYQIRIDNFISSTYEKDHKIISKYLEEWIIAGIDGADFNSQKKITTVALNNKGHISRECINKIIGKLKPLLAKDDSTEQVFALNTLDSLEVAVIYKENLKWIKPLISDIHTINSDNEELLSNIKEKFME